MVLNRKDLSKTFVPPNKLRRLNNRSFNMNMGGSNDKDTANVNVFVRVRPPNEKELGDNFRNVVKVIDEKLLVFDPQEEQEPFFFRGTRQKMRDIAKKQNKQLEFLFDGVFGPDTCNWDVHCKTTHNIIESLLEGYNCSVFVYGATGAGKTFTMLGKREHSPGIMYHTMAELYHQISSISKEKKCHVGVSFVEVYNENVYDLLNPSGPLYLREDTSGVTIVGLKVENICNADQLLDKLAQGNNNRTQHPTDSNAESSRSHAVFQVYVRMTALDSGQVKIAKLSMIDLAGSERGVATGCKGMRFKEGSNINKSLLALGNCISSLADNLRHIPYRDSKLTRLLKDSLGGNCQTVMIANISPSSLSYEDTYNTLKFASRAKKITTKLSKNIISSDMGVTHYMKLVDKLETENTLLKSKIRALEKTATDSARAYSQMPDMSIWYTHLNRLFDEKIKLCQRLLTVKSEAHLLEWRIKYKNSVKDVLKSSQMRGSEMSIGKIELSVIKFEGRLNALQDCLSDLSSQLKNNSDKLAKLFKEMEEARVLQFVKKDLELKNALLGSMIQDVNNKHLTRLLLLQQSRAETCETALKLREPLLNDYHRVLSGLNLITKSMATDHENAISMMEGIKTVSWCDIEPEDIDAINTNVLSAIDLSFDDSLFTIDNQHQALKLEPTVLPITDVKDDESSTTQNDINIESNHSGYSEVAIKPEENNEHTCNSEISSTNEDVVEDEEDTANSTITLDTPTVAVSLPEVPTFNSDDSTSLLSCLTSTSQLSCSAKPDDLNGTVTVQEDVNCTSLSGATDLQPKHSQKVDNVNATFVKAKKNRPAFTLTFSTRKLNFEPLKRSDKENIAETKFSATKNGTTENFKSNFKNQILKTPAVKRYQQHCDRISSSRQALKPKPVNVALLTATPAMTSQVPSTQSLKITHPKTRIKNHPYKRPENNSKKDDKRR